MDALERSNRTWLCPVVFLDIVGYSQTPVSQQMAMKQRLNTFIARAIERVSVPDRLILDTGDGAAVMLDGILIAPASIFSVPKQIIPPKSQYLFLLSKNLYLLLSKNRRLF